jgi:hypothetical protein
MSLNYNSVILYEVDKEGKLNLLHNKQLSLELFQQVPESIVNFIDSKTT